MAKVFLAFFNGIKGANEPNAMPIFYEAFIKGLQDSGNDVFAVMHSNWNADFLKNGIPETLLNDIKLFNPDIIFLFNNNFYDLSEYFDCPIVVYEVDSPIYYRNKEALRKKPNRYKYFVASSSSIDIIHEEFGTQKENIIQVPFFTEVYAQDVEQKYNICFIGSKFKNATKSSLNNFLDTNPSDAERFEYRKLVRMLEENPFLTKEELLRDVQSKKVINTFNPMDLISLLSDYNRIKVLSSIADFGLDIWGTPNWATDFYNEPWLILNFHKEAVYTIKHNQDIYNSSKIGINIGHLQAKNGFPWRVFDIMASNACLVTEYHGDFAKYIPNLKLPYFSNAWEAREICKKLIENENYRLDIVAQSQELINKNYRFKNILGIMENDLNITLRADKMGSLKLSVLEQYLKSSIPATPVVQVPKLVKQSVEPVLQVKKLNFKNKIRYKIWRHLDKMLKRKGIIK